MEDRGAPARHLRGLGEHVAAVGAFVSDDGAREAAARVRAAQVHVHGRDLRQHLLGLPAVARRVLDLQLAPLRACAAAPACKPHSLLWGSVPGHIRHQGTVLHAPSAQQSQQRMRNEHMTLRHLIWVATPTGMGGWHL